MWFHKYIFSFSLNGDGWQIDWSVTPNFICSGGSIYVKDTCVEWTTGFTPNIARSQCIPVWGDGRRVGTESWDDANTSNGDGWSSTCTIEAGYSWTGGSLTSIDICVLWSAGYYQDLSNPTTWITRWGDGFRAGSEVWDDGNTSNGDGCLNNCSSIETGCIWTGGSSISKDTCTLWSSGYSPNLSKSVCITVWGDGLRVGSEVWDDRNTSNGDGCSSDCSLIESGYMCTGGSSTSKDICILWSSGFSPNSSKTACIAVWGDGFRASIEAWDDANISNGDGCSSDCSSIETGYSCSGGSPTSKDICTKWNKGLYQNASNPSQWIPKWGDGVRASYEAWDDGNALSGDGWSSDCLKIESGWVWFGGFVRITDVWLQWDLGYDQNPDYSKCIGAEVPRDAKGMAAAAQITAIMGISTNLIVTVFSSSSSSSSNSFGMLNQIQLVILLPLIGAYIPQKIYDYLKSMNTSLFNMNFLPTSNSESTISLKSVFDFKQPNSYLYLLQLNSGSSIVNILNLTTTVGFVIAAHILLLII